MICFSKNLIIFFSFDHSGKEHNVDDALGGANIWLGKTALRRSHPRLAQHARRSSCRFHFRSAVHLEQLRRFAAENARDEELHGTDHSSLDENDEIYFGSYYWRYWS